MPKRAAGVTAAKLRTAKPGRYVDGDGLMLEVRENGTRFWLLRYSFGGKRREAGLGRAGEGANDVTLAEARQKSADMHRLLRAGIDPLAHREAEAAAQKAAAQQATAQAVTFRTVADLYMKAHEARWNPKLRLLWRHTLETYAFPHLGDLPVADVVTVHVMAALNPIWWDKTETAARVRSRIESVLDYAGTMGWRSGDNPARWRGHLANLLPARTVVAPTEHRAALPWKEIAAFVADLRGREGMGVRALEFVILTAARTNEALGARWQEIDLGEAVWTVPAGRMKARKEHQVPLSEAALATLRTLLPLRPANDAQGAAFVFPGTRKGRPLSGMGMLMALRRMGRDDLTVHGFRSTFRDWAAEHTAYAREVAEAALAHTLADKTEAAYQRGDFFEKRRRMMAEWAEFCARPAVEGSTVTPIRGAG